MTPTVTIPEHPAGGRGHSYVNGETPPLIETERVYDPFNVGGDGETVAEAVNVEVGFFTVSETVA